MANISPYTIPCPADLAGLDHQKPYLEKTARMSSTAEHKSNATNILFLRWPEDIRSEIHTYLADKASIDRRMYGHPVVMLDNDSKYITFLPMTSQAHRNHSLWDGILHEICTDPNHQFPAGDGDVEKRSGCRLTHLAADGAAKMKGLSGKVSFVNSNQVYRLPVEFFASIEDFLSTYRRQGIDVQMGETGYRMTEASLQRLCIILKQRASAGIEPRALFGRWRSKL